MERAAGFTIVELLVVIAVIGILVGISVVNPISAQANGRDSERSDDSAAIARLLELDYNSQVLTYPSYPGTTVFVSDSSTQTGTAAGANVNIFKAPGKSSSSVTAAPNNTAPTGTNTSGVTLGNYYYQPLTAAGALCTAATSSAPCVSFKIYYLTETKSPPVNILTSLHQQ